MDNNDNYSRISQYAGNRTNLRSKPMSQIHRIGGISKVLGSNLGDFLVSTWGNAFLAVGIIGVGGIFIFLVIRNAGVAIFAQNILPMFLMIIGLLFLALNAVLTNPVQGSQIVVSAKFLMNKLRQIHNAGERQMFAPFRFLPDDESQSIVEQQYQNKNYYMAVYNVRGTVSPVTFDTDLEIAGLADSNLLKNCGRDTVITTVVNVDKTTVKKRPLPINATPDMIAKRNMQYDITHGLPHNQQVKTTVLVVAPSVELLRERSGQFEAACQRGLVIGYQRLTGKVCKQRFKTIFGEGTI